jgi:hypothetical protein
MPKRPDRPRLPFGGEFSPQQIDLRTVLRIAAEHDGDRAGAAEAIRRAYFASAAQASKDPAEQQRKRAANVLIGLAAYGLYQDGRLTELGRELAAAADDAALYETFALHVLRERHGLTVLSAVRNLMSRGDKTTKGSIATELRRLGMTVPRAATHHLIEIAWLRKAGVFRAGRGYAIDEARTAEVLGVSLATLGEWDQLKNPQRAILRTLKALSVVHGSEPQRAQRVVELAEREYGAIFGAGDQLRKQVFQPLEAGGWVTMSQSSAGRGAKSGAIAPAPKLVELDLERMPSAVASDIPGDLWEKLTTPLQQIYEDLDSENRHSKGIALEVLALRLAIDLGITPRRFRLRGTVTGGAEVDLIAEAAHLHFSRWLFQCKNTRQVSVADLAKEIGMCVLLRGQVIVMVTTGRFADTVESHARMLAETTGYQAVLVDHSLLASYKARGPVALYEYFHEAASQTLMLKRGQLEVEEAEEGG